MKENEKGRRFTRRQVLKMAGATAAGVAASSMVRRFIKPVNIIASEREKPSEAVPMATTEAERKEVAQKLKNASIHYVEISIDGATAKTHDEFRGVNGAFDKAVQGLKNCVEADLCACIASTATKNNWPILCMLT